MAYPYFQILAVDTILSILCKCWVLGLGPWDLPEGEPVVLWMIKGFISSYLWLFYKKLGERSNYN